MQVKHDSGHFRVVRDEPRNQWLKQFIWGCVTASLVAGSWFFGRYDASTEQVVLTSDNERLKALAAEQRQQLDQKSQQLAIYERGRKVDQKALESVRQELLQLEEKKALLEKELVLYKSIIVPEQLAEGVRVQRLDLRPGETDDQYYLKLVLTQVAQKHVAQRGSLEAWVVGIDRNDKEQKIPLASLAEGLEYPVKLGFRYFQSVPLDGGLLELTLPDGFRPTLLSVLITLEGRKPQQIEQDFDWPEPESSVVDGDIL